MSLVSSQSRGFPFTRKAPLDRGAIGLILDFGLIADLVDRVYGHEGLGIGLANESHQLSVFALIYDSDDLFSLHLVISAGELVQRCAAMKIVEYKVHNLVKLRRDDADSALDVHTKDKVVHHNSCEIRADNAEDYKLCINVLAAERRDQRNGNSRDGNRTTKLDSAIFVDYFGDDIHSARRSVAGEQNRHRPANDQYVANYVEQGILCERLKIREQYLENTKTHGHHDGCVHRFYSELRADRQKSDDQEYHVDRQAEHRDRQRNVVGERHRKRRAATNGNVARDHKEEDSRGGKCRTERYDHKILQVAK